jgi:molecular chaperone GrpE
MEVQEENIPEMIIPVEGASNKQEPENAAIDVPVSDKKPETPNLEAVYLDQLQRLKAEFNNYRKRVEKEREEYYSLAKGRVILNLLPVMDDLERMVQYSKGKSDHLTRGIELVFQKMRSILISEGLEEINPVEKPFDPSFHEALGLVETGPDKDGLVVDECERGYMLDGRLLRTSRVRVGNGPQKSEDQQSKDN